MGKSSIPESDCSSVCETMSLSDCSTSSVTKLRKYSLSYNTLPHILVRKLEPLSLQSAADVALPFCSVPNALFWNTLYYYSGRYDSKQTRYHLKLFKIRNSYMTS